METVSITIPKQFLNEVLNFVYSLCQNPPTQSQSATEIDTIKFSAGDIQLSSKFCESQYDEQNLIDTLKNLGIKYSEVKRYCKQYPENVNIGIERAGKPGTKNPTAMFIATLKNPGEIKTGDRLALSPDTNISAQPLAMTGQQQAQLIKVKEILAEKDLIEYKANEWKLSKAFAHKEVEFIKADVIASYLNDPIRLQLDKVAFATLQERKQKEEERLQLEQQKAKELEEELQNLTPEEKQQNIFKLRLALDKCLANSSKFSRKEEVVF